MIFTLSLFQIFHHEIIKWKEKKFHEPKARRNLVSSKVNFAQKFYLKFFEWIFLNISFYSTNFYVSIIFIHISLKLKYK